MNDLEEVTDTTIPIMYSLQRINEDTLLVEFEEYQQVRMYIRCTQTEFIPTINTKDGTELPYMFQHSGYVGDLVEMVVSNIMKEHIGG